MSDPSIPSDASPDRFRESLRELARGPALPEASEDRTVARLRAEGLLAEPRAERRTEDGVDHGRPRAGNGWRTPAGLLAATAAAATLFLGGFLAGRSSPDPHAPGPEPVAATATSSEPTHALFLLGGVQPGPDEAERVEEYRTWATELARSGRLAAGEKLDARAWLLRADEPTARRDPEAHDAAPLSGFFLLSVEAEEEALAIARSCPHLRHGGRVLLRPIEPT